MNIKAYLLKTTTILAIGGAGFVAGLTGAGISESTAIPLIRTFSFGDKDPGAGVITYIRNQLQKALNRLETDEGITLTLGDVCTKYDGLALDLRMRCVEDAAAYEWQGQVRRINGSWTEGEAQ